MISFANTDLILCDPCLLTELRPVWDDVCHHHFETDGIAITSVDDGDYHLEGLNGSHLDKYILVDSGMLCVADASKFHLDAEEAKNSCVTHIKNFTGSITMGSKIEGRGTLNFLVKGGMYD